MQIKPTIPTVLAVCCLLLSAGAMGQTAGANWQRVQQLPVHTKVHISTDTKGRYCTIDQVEEQKLTCTAGRIIQASHYTFARSEIRSIKVARYYRSTAAGAGIGAVAGLVIGVAIAHGGNDQIVSNGTVRGVSTALFAIPGALIGLGTDFARGPTVYRRP